MCPQFYSNILAIVRCIIAIDFFHPHRECSTGNGYFIIHRRRCPRRISPNPPNQPTDHTQEATSLFKCARKSRICATEQRSTANPTDRQPTEEKLNDMAMCRGWYVDGCEIAGDGNHRMVLKTPVLQLVSTQTGAPRCNRPIHHHRKSGCVRVCVVFVLLWVR